jgi:glycosyltransferase involved in cell wall biosynthesis
MPKVSVIVPVYNVSLYIERCARSLFEQTLDDVEYIFINDCTPDNSMKILEKVVEDYPGRKSQLLIFKMSSNSRQAAVRRQGIKLASGDFIIHCDSDDWVDTDLYEKMYEEAMRSGADVVICPIRDEYQDSGRTRPLGILPTNCHEVLVNWYKNSLGMFSWNKLVKTSVYKKYDVLPFEGINMWEDNGLFLRIFYYAKGLSYISNDAVYHYNRDNVNAMTNGYGRTAIDQMIDCARRIESFFQDKPDFQLFEKTVLALKFYARINLVTDSYRSLQEYRRTFPESDAIISSINLNAFSAKGKIRFLAVKYKMAWLFVTLFKVKKIVSNFSSCKFK